MSKSGTQTENFGDYRATLNWEITENYSNNTCTVKVSGSLKKVSNVGGTGSQGDYGGLYCYIPNGQYHEAFSGATSSANINNGRFVYNNGGSAINIANDGTVTNLPERTRTFNLDSIGVIENIHVGITWSGISLINETRFENYGKTANVVLSTKASNGHMKVNGTWKDGYFWRKINGTWKRCLIWQKINGTWKKGI